MRICNNTQKICDAIVAAGGRPYLVGGCVRDFVMGEAGSDIDIEVFSLSMPQIVAAVRPLGKLCEVGQAFGILKVSVDGVAFDLSIPRRENKVGVGHKDYEVATDPNMTPKDAAARRDFTMNAMYYDYVAKQLVDPYQGQVAIQFGALHPTSLAFQEDALRILRGMQFASRFAMSATDTCKDYGKYMVYEYAALPKERIWGEWAKWAGGNYPQAGIQFLWDCRWLGLYLEILALHGCRQDSVWHPEGDAYYHTLLVCDAMALICTRENIVGDDRVVLMFAALCHDMGKPSTTEFIDGHIRSRGHCEAGVPIAKQFLESIGAPNWVAERVCPLVAEHLAHVRETITARGTRRLAVRLQPATINELCLLIEADMGGRPPLPGGMPASAVELKALAEKLNIQFNEPKPIIMGRHLLDIGMQAGPELGALLKLLFSAQLNGEFNSLAEGLEYAKQLDKMMP